MLAPKATDAKTAAPNERLKFQTALHSEAGTYPFLSGLIVGMHVEVGRSRLTGVIETPVKLKGVIETPVNEGAASRSSRAEVGDGVATGVVMKRPAAPVA